MPTQKFAHKFIGGLFIIVKSWKQPKYPLIGEWINKKWYIHIKNSVRPHTHTKEVLLHLTTWMNLKDMLGERSQSQKTTYYIISII